MRDDLLGAKAAVDWAKAQIPILQDRLIVWQRRRPYKIVTEPDPADQAWELLVAYPDVPLDSLIYGDVGAIINSARAALDLLMSALLIGNGKKPNSKAHFPIRAIASEFFAAVDMLERKNWITSIEAAAIKRTKAYDGGDAVLYSIHQLDVKRKHERLLIVEPQIADGWVSVGGVKRGFERFDDKTVLHRLPVGTFRPTPGNSHVTAQIFLNEPTVGVADKPAVLALRVFTERVSALIAEFP